jgi:radical SAM protein with 4Fe4S-binding SPASM domain
MIYYIDPLYTIIPDKEKYILYCGNLRKAIKLTYSKMYLYKTIAENQNRMSLDEMLEYYKIDRKEYEKFAEQMVQKKIFFAKKEEFQKEDFGHRYNRISSEQKLKIAYLHVTQRCNLNCYYCYNKKNINTEREELSKNEWKMVIDRLYEEGVRTFVITGGEPTLRTDLDEILTAVPADCKVNILTNGTLLINEVKKIFQYADEVIVSLDSDIAENNDKNRKNSVYYNVISNIKDLNEEQKKKLTVRTVITKHNANDIASLRMQMEKIGIRYITSGYLPNSSREWNEFIPPEYEFSDVTSMQKIIICGAGKSEIAIDSNGDVYPCQSLIKSDFCLGNIKSENWRQQMREKLQKKMPQTDINKIKKCKDCVYKYFCGNGCKAIIFNIYHQMDRCNDFFCEFYKQKAGTDIKNLFRRENGDVQRREG